MANHTILGGKVRLTKRSRSPFGDKPLSQITAGTVQEYRISRLTKAEGKSPPRARPCTTKR